MPKNHGYGLSGEPWHVEYLRTESDDDRRDKRRCFFFEKGNYCSVKKERCIGSSHCDHYREKESRPKAAKYLQEDGRYFQVKESIEKPNMHSAALIGGSRGSKDGIISYQDYVDPKMKVSTYKIMRYAPGTTVESKKFGNGVIQSFDHGYYHVQFQSKVSMFTMDAFDQGYLKIKSSTGKEVVYQASLIHPLLPAFYVTEGESENMVMQEIRKVKNRWIEEWNNRIGGMKDKPHSIDSCRDIANQQTVLASQIRYKLENIQKNNKPTLLINSEDSTERHKYIVQEPDYPKYVMIPREPMLEDYGQARKMGFFQRLFHLAPIKVSRVSRDQYESDHLLWKQNVEKAEKENARLYQEYIDAHDRWEKNRSAFDAAEDARIQQVKERKAGIQRGDVSIIEKYFGDVLDRIKIPLCFEKKFNVTYDKQVKQITAEYCLPSLRSIPRTTRTSYLERSDSFKEEYLSVEEFRKLQETANEQIMAVVKNSIKAYAEAEKIDVKSVVVRGYTELVDERARQVVRRYLQNKKKDDFIEISL